MGSHQKVAFGESRQGTQIWRIDYKEKRLKEGNSLSMRKIRVQIKLLLKEEERSNWSDQYLGSQTDALRWLAKSTMAGT